MPSRAGEPTNFALFRRWHHVPQHYFDNAQMASFNHCFFFFPWENIEINIRQSTKCPAGDSSEGL
jgi:hypothetical protein